MKTILCIFLIIFLSFQSFSQKFDLIVKNKGDSIACNIDSITSNNIYFEFKQNDKWIHTFIQKSEVSLYKLEEIDESSFEFSSGSSIIKSKKLNNSSKKFDLIVAKKGKTYNCFIDSITESRIYFSILKKSIWVSTYINKEDVEKYESNAESKESLTRLENHYKHRHIFAPSSFGIKEGDFYYNTYYLLMHDFQYGFSDRFSLGFGTTIFFNPVYIMPTFTFPINEKSAIAIGDLIMVSPYPDLSFFGSLTYGLYTRGNKNANFSVGAGVWATIDSDIADQAISPAFNFSAQVKISENAYFLTENFFFNYDGTTAAYNPTLDISENYFNRTSIIFGLTGFRFIMKRNPRKSIQLSLLHLFIYDENTVPDKYKTSGWEVHQDSRQIFFIPIPMISYSWKIAKRL